eukprot:SAG31_NODE_1547_length_7925_cov_3.563251_9_plen_59_part_00
MATYEPQDRRLPGVSTHGFTKALSPQELYGYFYGVLAQSNRVAARDSLNPVRRPVRVP